MVISDAEDVEQSRGPVAADVADEVTSKPPFAVTMPCTKPRKIPAGPRSDWPSSHSSASSPATHHQLRHEGILEDFEIQGALFGATIATLVLTLEGIISDCRTNSSG